ncbi:MULTISPECIES: aminotransferase class V-fold PLP-dependent enzyme [Asticcacaulis]|uniref:aminotransferase class V-fold PLP-dependent enzyme n=1 Tax=Asticcacaulis TaxID=76890 RepID=UPI001AE9E754|nr:MULTISPECIES: cysteine desulfurase [Asticcacaulis]MBP2158194.1 cysteine desulfurase/selenocysteine lyase [Asticcacaulis solisilvae]MDR6799239.1 cysteine desulfurase/selenocysteine lyase [Asticcacaulis sp. BE141]
MPFDVARAREDFPILSRQINDKPLIYLDSGASAQKPNAVIDAMSHAMRHSYANVHRGLHRLANETTDAYEAGRETVARFIKADVNEIIFTKSATEAMNLIAHSFGDGLKAGDVVLTTEMEHHANIVPWYMLAERKGVELKYVPILDDGSLDMAAFDAVLTDRVKIVAVTHMSNVLGTINPISEIIQKAHAVGAKTVIDGAQGIVHLDVDVKALDADFYVFSAHKLYGPTGLGVLYGKAELLNAMPPYQGGGEMIARVTKDKITWNEPPHRFEAGTPAILEVIGLKAAIDWLSQFDRAEVVAHEHVLYQRAYDRLTQINSLRVHGTAEGKGSILTFSLGQAHAHDVAQILDRYNVAVRAGTHCAEPLMTRLGVTSTVRASIALYNTEEEIDVLAEAVAKAQSFFA